MSEDDDRAYWERHAKNYARSMTFLGRPVPRMIELAGGAVRGLGRVLEVAAGTGLVTPSLARAAREVVATDYAEAMVRLLAVRVRQKRLSNVQCEQADIYALRYEPSSFDAVVAANVLHLVPDVAGALAAFRRVLKPEGRVIAPTFCHDETAFSSVLSRALGLTGFPGHRRFTTKTLRDALESAGLRVDRTETLRGWIPIGYVDGTFAR